MLDTVHDLLGSVPAAYHYVVIAVLVGLESTGIPLPGETMLVAAAIYAGTTGELDLSLIIAAAACGAIVGDNMGFWLGRGWGYRLATRYGRYVGIGQGKLKLGRYLFQRHGGKVVFFGRFVAILRILAAFLAGVNHMPWPQFLLFNIAGGLLWATIFGLGGFYFGDAMQLLVHRFGMVTLAVAVLGFVATLLLLRRHERSLIAEAERLHPEPLE